MGKATAEVFAAEGAHVAVTDFNEASAREAANLDHDEWRTGESMGLGRH